MESVRLNSLTTDELNNLSQGNSRVFSFLESIQFDLERVPPVVLEEELKIVGGNKVFPSLPTQNGVKRGTLYLSTGQYEAVVIGGNDKWRRLYDGTTYDPAATIP